MVQTYLEKKDLKMMPFAPPDLFFNLLQRDASDLSEEFWFIFKDAKLLVQEHSLQPVQEKNLILEHSLYLGKFKQLHVYVGEALSSIAPLNAIWVDLKTMYGKMNPELFALAGRAVQFAGWNRMHQFCGQCGSKTIDKRNERAKECPSCHTLHFPKIAPAIMALIQKEEEILLARSPHFPPGIYSILAGFVDPGETLESCVRREVFEEVGLQVENIQYYGSQPWPFPNSLMIAFTCTWKSGEIKIDHLEIEDAQWFKKDNLPPLPPEMSISRILLDTYL